MVHVEHEDMFALTQAIESHPKQRPLCKIEWLISFQPHQSAHFILTLIFTQMHEVNFLDYIAQLAQDFLHCHAIMLGKNCPQRFMTPGNLLNGLADDFYFQRSGEPDGIRHVVERSEEHTSELQSL